MTIPPPDGAALRALVERARYYVGNPSAWERYDDDVSELLRELTGALPAFLDERAADKALLSETTRERDEARARVGELEAALERCAVIVDRNLNRQNEKVTDVSIVARRALQSSKSGIGQ